MGSRMATPPTVKQNHHVVQQLLLGMSPQEWEAGPARNICTRMFPGGLFTTAKRQEQAQSPLTEEWINTMGCLPTMEC